MMSAEQLILIEKKRLATSGQNLSASELTLGEKAIAAVLLRMVSRINILEEKVRALEGAAK